MRSVAALFCGLCFGASLSGDALGAASAAEVRTQSGSSRSSGPASRTTAPAASTRPPKPRPPVRRSAAPATATRPPAAPAPSGPPRPERPPAASPPRVSSDSRIAAARELYQAGRYAEVPTALVKLLSESQLTAAQLAAVYELLASAYVALGQTELAIRCFSEVLSRRPAFALDPVRTSPKIRAALDQARRETARPQLAPPAAHRPL